MRQRDLEIALETVPHHPAPSADLEQYRTPPTIAADLLFRAYALGDLSGRRVLDLGCGTGMLALGAAILGADSTGIDVDAASVREAQAAAKRLAVAARFVEVDVAAWTGPADVVVTNPPFGAQRRGADRPFLVAALSLAPVAYVFHLSHTSPFVAAFAADHGAHPTQAWDYEFPLPWQFKFHEKKVERVPVTVTRFEVESRATPL